MLHKTTGIKSWPEDDRPREKLLKKGPRALTNGVKMAENERNGANTGEKGGKGPSTSLRTGKKKLRILLRTFGCQMDT